MKIGIFILMIVLLTSCSIEQGVSAPLSSSTGVPPSSSMEQEVSVHPSSSAPDSSASPILPTEPASPQPAKPFSGSVLLTVSERIDMVVPAKPDTIKELPESDYLAMLYVHEYGEAVGDLYLPYYVLLGSETQDIDTGRSQYDSVNSKYFLPGNLDAYRAYIENYAEEELDIIYFLWTIDRKVDFISTDAKRVLCTQTVFDSPESWHYENTIYASGANIFNSDKDDIRTSPNMLNIYERYDGESMFTSHRWRKNSWLVDQIDGPLFLNQFAFSQDETEYIKDVYRTEIPYASFAIRAVDDDRIIQNIDIDISNLEHRYPDKTLTIQRPQKLTENDIILPVYVYDTYRYSPSSFGFSHGFCLYYRIDRRTGSADYLFAGPLGSLSPDLKHIVFTIQYTDEWRLYLMDDLNEIQQGVYFYEIETGEYNFIPVGASLYPGDSINELSDVSRRFSVNFVNWCKRDILDKSLK